MVRRQAFVSRQMQALRIKTGAGAAKAKKLVLRDETVALSLVSGEGEDYADQPYPLRRRSHADSVRRGRPAGTPSATREIGPWPQGNNAATRKRRSLRKTSPRTIPSLRLSPVKRAVRRSRSEGAGRGGGLWAEATRCRDGSRPRGRAASLSGYLAVLSATTMRRTSARAYAIRQRGLVHAEANPMPSSRACRRMRV